MDVFEALSQPLRALVDPGERIYWLFLASSLAMPFVVIGLRRGARALRDGLFSRAIWAHASSRADITLLFVKALLGAVVRVPWLAATAGAAMWLGMSLHEWFGPASVPDWSRTTVAIVYGITLFVAWDLSRFVVHAAMHRFRVLWAFHEVHHSAQVLTPLTLYRTHPVESLLYDVRGLVTTGAVTGVFLYAFAGTAQPIELLGINALGFVFNLAGANLRHSHVWLRFGWLERWLISPAQHQLHHASAPRLQNSNYGTWLALWDRLLGSWLAAPAVAPRTYGVEGGNHAPDRVLSMLVGPVVDAWRVLRAPRTP